MKIKVFPIDYCPMIASGPCPPDLKRIGIDWSEDDTQRMREMEKLAVTVNMDKPPLLRVYQVLEK